MVLVNDVHDGGTKRAAFLAYFHRLARQSEAFVPPPLTSDL